MGGLLATAATIAIEAAAITRHGHPAAGNVVVRCREGHLFTTFEGEDLGVVDEPIDHRAGDDVGAEDLAPAREWLLEVTIRLARS